jgi:hypothetical protein
VDYRRPSPIRQCMRVVYYERSSLTLTKDNSTIVHNSVTCSKPVVVLMNRNAIRAAANQGGPCVALVQKQCPSVQVDVSASEI